MNISWQFIVAGLTMICCPTFAQQNVTATTKKVLPLPFVVKDGLRIEIRQIKRSAQLHFWPVPEPTKDDISLQMAAYTDASKRILSTLIIINKIVDENEHSLITASTLISDDFDGKTPSEIFFQVPSTTGNRIAKIAGYARFRELQKSEVWEIPDIFGEFATGKDLVKTAVIGNVSRQFRIVTARKLPTSKSTINAYYGNQPQTQDIYDIVISETDHDVVNGKLIPFDRDQAIKSGRATLPTLRLLDAQGREFSEVFGNRSYYEPESLKWTFTSNPEQSKDGAQPAKFVMEIPTKIEEIKIPFEFTDIPLPQFTK